MSERGLIWFRSDLRVSDNLALSEACVGSEALYAVFILTPKTWQSHGVSTAKIHFLLQNLIELSDTLWRQGIALLIRSVDYFSDCPKVLQQLCQQYDIGTLYFNNEYPVDERNRDDLVRKTLLGQVAIKSFHEQLILSPGTVLSKQNKPFQIFTPFKNEWLSNADEQQAWRPSEPSDKQFKSDSSPDPIPSQLPGFEALSITLRWAPGDSAAQRVLQVFCDNSISNYQATRDFPDIDGTSQLSPYLAQGVISARQCISAAMAACGASQLKDLSGNEGAATWVSELIWREFYHHIVYFHPDICRHKPFRLNTDRIPWQHDEALLDAWKKGMTGFPIVDAAMRQLAQTGWMHNRLRMITAMFLSKILLLDWRLGEQHFMAHLIDGDFAANNGGWQWCASTGTDAVPYFRIFNPTRQSQRFDPEGDFIRRYCPELAALDRKAIHEPFAKGVVRGKLDYPRPIVDYTAMRSKTIAIFKAL